MSADVGIEELGQARQLLREYFMKEDSRLLRLIDEPFLSVELYDKFARLLEFRSETRGVIVDVWQEFDGIFGTVGADDEIRMLTIVTPIRIEDNLERISVACLAWIIEGKSEQEVAKVFK